MNSALDLTKLDEETIASLSNEDFQSVMAQMIDLQAADRKENQLLFYQPASAACRRVHASTATWIGVGGGNGCLPLHAPVMMASGEYRSLGDIAVGDMVMAADPVTGETCPSPVTHVWRSGKKPVYRITFSDGGSFEATVEHKVPMYLGSGRSTSKGNPKVPHKRVLGDYIEAIQRRGKANPSKRIAAVSPQDIQAAGKCRIRLHPYLLGALIGDGSFSRSVKFHNIDDNVLARVQKHVEAVGGRLVYYDRCDYGVNSDVVRMEFSKIGMRRCTARDKHLPAEVFAWGREDRKELLSGLIDTDGTKDWFTSASARLANDVARLVKSLGGKATVHHREVACQNGYTGEAWSVYLRLNERLPLSMPRKQAVNQRGREIDYRRRICRDAELVGVFECGDIEVGHPAHCYITGDNVIVSNSSKTETCLVDLVAAATGVIPMSCPEIKNHFRGPINTRIVVESITTTLHNIILPKLQWNKWTGISRPGGDKGHWGWVPKLCLKDGDWQTSWSEKTRTLTVLCRDPDEYDRVLGESTIQFMSHDQDAEDFASGDFHIILHDEPTKYAIWVENQARTMRTNGRCMLAMTWPDDPAIPVDWIFDELYEPGQPGPRKSQHHDWIELDTRQNRNLDQTSVQRQSENWSAAIQTVRLGGKPIRFSNRVHPLFTDTDDHWSFAAGKVVEPRYEDERAVCPETGSHDVVAYNHVQEIEPSNKWPTVFLLDPHPRKPHMFCWVQVNPNDDYEVIHEDEVDGTPDEVWELVDEYERANQLYVALRLIDPNMGMSPSSGRDRSLNWRDEFADAGLACDLANDSDVGRGRINEYLQPDPYTRRPRLHISSMCQNTIHQFKRYCWDDHKRNLEKDQKQAPKPKYDDYPTLLKYFMNELPTFKSLREGPHIIHRGGRRPYGS